MHNKPARMVCRFLRELSEKREIPRSSLSATIRKSELFNTLIEGSIVREERSGAGWKIVVAKPDALTAHLRHRCPGGEEGGVGVRGENVRKYRNSKSSRRSSYRLAFVRSLVPYMVNGLEIEPGAKPRGWQVDEFFCRKLCFVENLENFMEDDRLLREKWTLFYVLGRVGKNILERMDAEEVLCAPDLDYAGLNEFARIKEHFKNASLYVPTGYQEDALKYGKRVKRKQKATAKLLCLAEEDPVVQSVLDFLRREGEFMEQEGYRARS